MLDLKNLLLLFVPKTSCRSLLNGNGLRGLRLHKSKLSISTSAGHAWVHGQVTLECTGDVMNFLELKSTPKTACFELVPSPQSGAEKGELETWISTPPTPPPPHPERVGQGGRICRFERHSIYVCDLRNGRAVGARWWSRCFNAVLRTLLFTGTWSFLRTVLDPPQPLPQPSSTPRRPITANLEPCLGSPLLGPKIRFAQA